MDTISDTLTTKISTVKLMENGLLKININPNVIISVEDIKDLLEATDKIGQGKQFKKLVIIGEYSSADVEAMRLGGSEDGCRNKIAEAYVIKSLAQRILANFYVNVIKPIKPTKFFTSEKEATTWLLGLN